MIPNRSFWITVVLGITAAAAGPAWAKEIFPREKAVLTYAPEVPPPILRRKPAIVEVHPDSGHQEMTDSDHTGMPHNVDFHAVTGPGGGAKVTTAVEGEEKVAWFKLLHPGLFIYHCAAPPVMDHIANGM